MLFLACIFQWIWGAFWEGFGVRFGMILPEITGDFEMLMGWADEFRDMDVRANAETPEDAQMARVIRQEAPKWRMSFVRRCPMKHGIRQEAPKWRTSFVRGCPNGARHSSGGAQNGTRHSSGGDQIAYVIRQEVLK